jgi:methionine synthase II (cobalamin-independent)
MWRNHSVLFYCWKAFCLSTSKEAQIIFEFSNLSFKNFTRSYYFIFSITTNFTREVIAELKESGAKWIQFDEPALVKDLDSKQLDTFSKAYSELESSLSGLNVVVETYFADVPVEAYK